MIPPRTSFRDPSGRCFLIQGRVFRVLAAKSAIECDAFLKTSCARRFIESRQLVETRRLDPNELDGVRTVLALEAANESEPAEAILEHERVPFANYPCEWAPEMLWEAGRLTLELARAALVDG